MSMEKPDWSDKKGWARGDDAERLVEAEQKPADAELMRKISERIEQLTEEAQNDLHQELLKSGVIEQSFEVDGFGILKIDESDPAPSLWHCAEPTGDNGRIEKGMDAGYTGEDLMRAGMQLQEKFPDIQFEFKDERPKKFTYTATLRRSE